MQKFKDNALQTTLEPTLTPNFNEDVFTRDRVSASHNHTIDHRNNLVQGGQTDFMPVHQPEGHDLTYVSRYDFFDHIFIKNRNVV